MNKNIVQITVIVNGEPHCVTLHDDESIQTLKNKALQEAQYGESHNFECRRRDGSFLDETLKLNDLPGDLVVLVSRKAGIGA